MWHEVATASGGVCHATGHGGGGSATVRPTLTFEPHATPKAKMGCLLRGTPPTPSYYYPLSPQLWRETTPATNSSSLLREYQTEQVRRFRDVQRKADRIGGGRTGHGHPVGADAHRQRIDLFLQLPADLVCGPGEVEFAAAHHWIERHRSRHCRRHLDAAIHVQLAKIPRHRLIGCLRDHAAEGTGVRSGGELGDRQS